MGKESRKVVKPCIHNCVLIGQRGGVGGRTLWIRSGVHDASFPLAITQSDESADITRHSFDSHQMMEMYYPPGPRASIKTIMHTCLRLADKERPPLIGRVP